MGDLEFNERRLAMPGGAFVLGREWLNSFQPRRLIPSSAPPIMFRESYDAFFPDAPLLRRVSVD